MSELGRLEDLPPDYVAALRAQNLVAEADTCCAPGYTPVTLTNARADAPTFLFIADETPLHTKLGVFEVRE